MNGIIKEFKENPYIGNSELTIYIGNGKLYEKGTYNFKRRSMLVKTTRAFLRGKDKLYQIAYGQKYAMERGSLKFVTASGGTGGDGEIAWENELEEVIITAPGGGNGNDPWEDYDPWEGLDGGDPGDGGSTGGGSTGGGSTGGGGNAGGGSGGIPTGPPPGGGNSQETQTDKEPTAYDWRSKLITMDDWLEHLVTLTPRFITNEAGEQVGNPDVYNCHYYTFSNIAPESMTHTLADIGSPMWVYGIHINYNFDRVRSGVQVGDIVLYFIPGGASGHLLTHSGTVIQVDSQGYATQISSKMGEHEIITHHPRDVPIIYGSTDPTFTSEGKTYDSREYYRRNSN